MERASLAKLREDRHALREMLADTKSQLESAANTRKAMEAQLERFTREGETLLERTTEAEARAQREGHARFLEEQRALMLGERLTQLDARSAWLQEEVGRVENARRRAESKERLCEQEAQQLSLRMGLFQRMVTSEPHVQYLASTRCTRDATVHKALVREESARKKAWGRLHELDAKLAPSRLLST